MEVMTHVIDAESSFACMIFPYRHHIPHCCRSKLLGRPEGLKGQYNRLLPPSKSSCIRVHVVNMLAWHVSTSQAHAQRQLLYMGVLAGSYQHDAPLRCIKYHTADKSLQVMPANAHTASMLLQLLVSAGVLHQVLDLLLQLVNAAAQLINAPQDLAAHAGESVRLEAQEAGVASRVPGQASTPTLASETLSDADNHKLWFEPGTLDNWGWCEQSKTWPHHLLQQVLHLQCTGNQLSMLKHQCV